MLVGGFGANHAQSGDVLLTGFRRNDEQRMPHAQQNIIAHKTTRSAVSVAERMQILVEAVETGGKHHRVGGGCGRMQEELKQKEANTKRFSTFVF